MSLKEALGFLCVAEITSGVGRRGPFWGVGILIDGIYRAALALISWPRDPWCPCLLIKLIILSSAPTCFSEQLLVLFLLLACSCAVSPAPFDLVITSTTVHTMPSIWNPEAVLSLHHSSSSPLHCVTTSRSSHKQCTRPIPSSDLTTIDKLLSDMSLQMPDQIDHPVLLRLARSCLCTAHRGRHDASVIYRWTELLSCEAEAIWQKKNAPDEPATAAPTASEPVSPASSVFKDHIHTACCTPLAPQPQRVLPKQSRLLTNLDRASLADENPLTLPTPKPMELSDDRSEGWDNETLVPSPLFASISARLPLSRTPAALTLIPDLSGDPVNLPPTPPDSSTTATFCVRDASLVMVSTPCTVETAPTSSCSSEPEDAIRTTTVQTRDDNSLRDLPLVTPGFAETEAFVNLLRETKAQHEALLKRTAALEGQMVKMREARERDGKVLFRSLVFLLLGLLPSLVLARDGLVGGMEASVVGWTCLCVLVGMASWLVVLGWLSRRHMGKVVKEACEEEKLSETEGSVMLTVASGRREHVGST
jgi:hypothetical protein